MRTMDWMVVPGGFSALQAKQPVASSPNQVCSAFKSGKVLRAGY